jgi:hypothetical protein
MKSYTSNSKLIGMLGIILGFLCLGGFLAIDNNKLIIPVTNLFPAKYFLIILIINCGIYLIIFGILNFTGALVPYYSKTITKYERAKHHLLGIILSIPVWISISSLIFVVSKSKVWKILVSLALIYIIWLFYSNIKVFKKGAQETITTIKM